MRLSALGGVGILLGLLGSARAADGDPPPAPVAAAPARTAAPGPAASGKQRVAVVRLEFDGGVVEASRELFGQRLGEGLAAAQFDVVPAADVAKTLAGADASLPRCREP